MAAEKPTDYSSKAREAEAKLLLSLGEICGMIPFSEDYYAQSQSCFGDFWTRRWLHFGSVVLLPFVKKTNHSNHADRDTRGGYTFQVSEKWKDANYQLRERHRSHFQWFVLALLAFTVLSLIVPPPM